MTFEIDGFTQADDITLRKERVGSSVTESPAIHGSTAVKEIQNCEANFLIFRSLEQEKLFAEVGQLAQQNSGKLADRPRSLRGYESQNYAADGGIRFEKATQEASSILRRGKTSFQNAREDLAHRNLPTGNCPPDRACTSKSFEFATNTFAVHVSPGLLKAQTKIRRSGQWLLLFPDDAIGTILGFREPPLDVSDCIHGHGCQPNHTSVVSRVIV
jgi:hypothetical protein